MCLGPRKLSANSVYTQMTFVNLKENCVRVDPSEECLDWGLFLLNNYMQHIMSIFFLSNSFASFQLFISQIEENDIASENTWEKEQEKKNK